MGQGDIRRFLVTDNQKQSKAASTTLPTALGATCRPVLLPRRGIECCTTQRTGDTLPLLDPLGNTTKVQRVPATKQNGAGPIVVEANRALPVARQGRVAAAARELF